MENEVSKNKNSKRTKSIVDIDKDRELLIADYVDELSIEELRHEIERREVLKESLGEMEAETKINAHSSKKVYDEEYYNEITKAERAHAKKIARKRAQKMYGEQETWEKVTQGVLMVIGIALFTVWATIVVIPRSTIELPLWAMTLMIGVSVIIFAILSLWNRFLYRNNLKLYKKTIRELQKIKLQVKEKTSEKKIKKISSPKKIASKSTTGDISIK